MFKTRLISGVILLAVIISVSIVGGDILLIGTLGISLIGMYELYRAVKIQKSIIAILSYVMAIIYFAELKWNFIQDSFLMLMILLVFLMIAYVLHYPNYTAKDLAFAFLGIFYVAVMLSYLYQIRMMKNGVYLVFMTLICSWGSDTFAYCVGMLFGKHKLAPVLSPKKSIEGAIGGVLGAAFLGGIYFYVFRKPMGLQTREIIVLVIICAIAAIISMVGDLCASAIKRNYDVKDFGKLIPGHGGILDRFDSVIITAPIIFYLAQYFV